MDINEIIKIADAAYPDGVISCQWNDKTKQPRKVPLYGMGDTLARFIVIEIAETYDPKAGTQEQLRTAAHCIFRASTQCTDVEYALLDAAGSLKKPSKHRKAAQHKPTTSEKVQAIVDTLMEEGATP